MSHSTVKHMLLAVGQRGLRVLRQLLREVSASELHYVIHARPAPASEAEPSSKTRSAAGTTLPGSPSAASFSGFHGNLPTPVEEGSSSNGNLRTPRAEGGARNAGRRAEVHPGGRGAARLRAPRADPAIDTQRTATSSPGSRRSARPRQ